MDNEFTPTADDIENAISQVQDTTRLQAVTSLDANPDDAARALELSKVTGVPPTVIHDDLEGFERRHKSSLVRTILDDHPEIRDYIRGNPLAAKVSNDDYGNLAKIAQSMPDQGFWDTVFGPKIDHPIVQDLLSSAQGLYQNLTSVNLTAPPKVEDIDVGHPAVKGLLGAAQGLYEGLTSPIPEKDAKALADLTSFERSRYVPWDIGRRAFEALAGAISGGAVEFTKSTARELGLPETQVEQLGRDVSGLIETEGARHPEHLGRVATKIEGEKYRGQIEAQVAFYDVARANTEGLNKARPWIEAGQEPPRGIDPAIDQFKVETNAKVLDRIDQIADAVQASTTLERAPEEFNENFLKRYMGDTSISLSADRVLELYGDKAPLADDNLLGWVPGIEAKLEAARTVGEDVHIPLRDWLTWADPALRKELRDDVRVWSGGITAREAAEPIEPTATLDSPLAQVRGAAGTEPMFAIGDRKLELKPTVADKVFHEFQFVDQQGKPVGELALMPDPEKKELYVANINGLAGLYSNSFGPSLIRDLKRQIKAMYPDYEWLTGHRVSGARERAGTWEDKKIGYPRIRLALEEPETPESFKAFHDIFEENFREQFGYGLSAIYEMPELMSARKAEVAQAIKEEVSRIAGIEPTIVSDIRMKDKPGRISGAYFQAEGSIPPEMIIDLFSDDPIGIARHESIHHLYRAGLFTKEEWSGLLKAAKDEGWIERYGIDRSYFWLDKLGQSEEAIAEAFRDWAKNKDERGQPTTLVTQAFSKIAELWERIQARMKEIFGRELTHDEIFGRAVRGEVQARRGEAGRGQGGPAFALEEAKAKVDQLRANAAGLDLKTFQKLQGLIQDRYQRDLQASMKRAERDQKRVQSKEWKARSAELATEVESTLRQRPDIAGYLFVTTGELLGKQTDRHRFSLRAADLNPEQVKALGRPHVAADGLPVDAVANMFGYASGDDFITAVTDHIAARAGATSKDYFRKLVDTEVERQMQSRYGDLQANILLDAQDQALSENELNILIEEWQGAAMQAGIATVDKEVAKATALDLFSKQRLGDVSSARFMTQMLKHSKDAEKDLISGKPADAVARLERRVMVGFWAAEAKKIEKARAGFDKVAKQFAKREVPSVEPEYTNFVHGILMQVGKPVRRSSTDLARQIEAGEAKNLEDFVAIKEASLREVPVWDQLYDSNWRKDLDDLTVEEFRAVNDSIKALVWNGRDERKIYRQGEAADLAEIKKGLVENVATSVEGKVRAPRKRSILKTYFVNHLQMENIFNRWDAFDSKGLWNQYVMRDLIDGTNQVDAWKKEYAKKIKDLPVPEGLTRTIDNPIFRDQDTDTLIPFTRKNLLAVMLNTGAGTGAKSNLIKLAKGYGLEPAEVMAWVHANATKADWDFVQGVWDTFKDIKTKADTMYRSLSGGVAPESIGVYPIQTPFGEIKGGYYPIIFHPEMEGRSKKLMGRDPLEQEGFFRAATPAGYTKSRTGYIAPLSLDMDQIPVRMGQMLHDVGLRPAVLNAAKVFYDHDVRSAIRKHYGDEYKDQLVPYLRAVANASNEITKSQATFTRLSEFVRQNVITTLVGLNPGTVMKHGPSALVTSIREVGAQDFGRAVAGLFRINEETGENNWQFAMKNSLELQRRDRNWEETLYGTTGVLSPGDKFTPLRQKIMQWSSKPVAISDMLSAVPTWIASYGKEMGESGIHGDAVYAADRAVRRAHGSTAATSRTAVMRESSPWLTAVYNFFSDIMNRQMETIWKAGEALDLAKEKEYKAAMATVPALTASLFAYAVWPAIVEHMVSGEGDEKDSWAKTAGFAMTRTAASSWVGVRDAVNWMLLGYDPQFGLAGTAMKELLSVWKDLGKDKPLAKQQRGKLIQDATSFVGAATGMVPAQVGRVGRFVHDVNVGIEHPKGPWAWMVGLRFGTTKDHATTLERYMEGKRR